MQYVEQERQSFKNFKQYCCRHANSMGHTGRTGGIRKQEAEEGITAHVENQESWMLLHKLFFYLF